MKKNGRPTRYSEETGDKIANFIREGLTIKDACYGVGISDDTFRRWREKYPEFNKKVVEASNQQWDSAEAIAKYHSGYRGYKRPKVHLSPDYDANIQRIVCGCLMSSYMAKGRVYMKCSQAKGYCPGTNVSEEYIEEQLNDILDHLVPDNVTCERIYKELAERRNNSQQYYVNSIEEVRQAIRKIGQKESTLYEDRLCGRITVDTYDKIANDLKDEKEHYEQQLLELTANDKSFELDAATLLWMAQHARELYKSLKVEQKTRFLNLLLSNLKVQQKRCFHLC